MATPRAAMLITVPMQSACFSDATLRRIAGVTDLQYATVDDMTETAQRMAMTGAEIIITGWGTLELNESMLDAAPNLKLLCHAAGSLWHLIDHRFASRGVRVTTARDALARGVAEFAFGMMLMCMKGVWHMTSLTRSGKWDPEAAMEWVREPFGATVGIVGASHTGRHMIRLMQQLRLKEILVYDPYISVEDAAALGASRVELDDLMRRSDVVSLHTPATPRTRHLINSHNLSLMKDHAIFINTARGHCVDESALLDELETGRILACLDVTDPEPPDPGSRFYSLSNCILTPHISGAIKENKRLLGEAVANEIEAFVAGRPLQYEIDVNLRDRLA